MHLQRVICKRADYENKKNKRKQRNKTIYNICKSNIFQTYLLSPSKHQSI